ncbi:phenylalanine--tRNA ligase subunit alpha [Candidatus Beckwithbacteria bacterium]|nr:phenylalanine--tRNA ligase subunit alpha [Candidatus Beckwithbacteria bacterium]
MQDLLTIKLQAISALNDIQSVKDLEELKTNYLGKNGILKKATAQITTIPAEQRPTFGKTANEVKKELEQVFTQKEQELGSSKTQKDWFDVTMPGVKPPQGHTHLVSQTIAEIDEIFSGIGFTRSRYPEVEWDYYNFEALNMPADHPARDEWETLFIDAPQHPKYGKTVLATHTSNGQVREMLRLGSKPPIRMINIGKCYRRQQDVTHAIMFHQFEGLVVDKGITIAHLKGTMDYFARQFYGPGRKTRLRPFHFQFTEPSFEVDINCAVCLGTGMVGGKKCRTCKQGWHELGGSGMVHPNVLKAGGIDPNKYTGFAFGWGVERVYMMRSGVHLDDLRTMFENDVRFLKQF